MASNGGQSEDKALKYIEELFKTIIATSGIMLALLWGLTQRVTITALILGTVRWASLVFVLAIFLSLLGYQFIVSRTQQGNEITKSGPVPFLFLLTWLAFIMGCVLLVIAIFNLS
jgi:hypothetical protein